nr:transposase [Proteus mirabilis]
MPLSRLKWKNGCAGTGVTLPIFARGTWDENYVKVNGRWAYLYRRDGWGHRHAAGDCDSLIS